MNPKKIGVLFGMERSFPEALAKKINELAAGKVVAEPVSIDVVRLDLPLGYDLILDRISQDVPFYRTLLKFAALRGSQIVNNPFWWTAEDKFTANAIGIAAGVAIPKTVLLPHKSHPPGTRPESFSNLKFPLSWDAIFEYLGFPIFLKPALGGGWKNVYKVNNPEEFFDKYSLTGDLTMIAQEAIEFESYYRCYVIGRERVRIMRYDPKKPYLQNYVADEPPASPALRSRMERDAKALCNSLGHDFNTVEFAIRAGVPVAIDFTNPAPDADVNSVGKANFEWVVNNAAEFLIERVTRPHQLSLGGAWPTLFPTISGTPPESDAARAAAPKIDVTVTPMERSAAPAAPEPPKAAQAAARASSPSPTLASGASPKKRGKK